MLDSSFIQVNRRLEEERRAKFCGTASISTSSLKPTLRTTNHVRRPVSEPLKRLYREEHGCRKEDNRHHAKATISQHDFEAALLNAGISASRLQSDALPYPALELPPGVQLECLQGSDRIMAADEVFDGTNKHWIVDLYLDDLSDNLKTLFVEEYEYQKQPDDGEFYCKIRGYQGHYGDENPFFERIWLGRLSALSKNRRDLLDQLFRHKKYSDAFDALLAIPALFCGFRLTVVHQVWSDICGGDYKTMQLIDRPTVERLQGTAPGAFSTDHDELLSDLRSGRILGNFSEQQRNELWIRICNVSQQRLIPSLFTFFEDRKFLSTAADCMRRLTGVGSKVTVPRRLDEMFQDTNQQTDQCILQVSQTAYVTVPGDAATRFDLGCRQLWLAAFREFRELPADVKKKDVLAKARRKADEITLFEFASLANRLGFESDDLSNIMRASPYFEVAKRLLLSARKPGQYRYPNFEKCIQRVTEIFETAQPVSVPEMPHSFEMNECCVEPPIRCGIPRDNDHDRDQTKLFLPSILLECKTGQTRVTSFFIRRSVYLSYFGLPLSLADFVIGQQPTHHFDLGVNGANPAGRTGLGSGAHTNTAAQPGEQSKLDQLRELSQIEQAKLDHLRQLVQEQQDRLNQLTKSVDNTTNEPDFGQHSSGMEIVPTNIENGTREASLVGDFGHSSEENSPRATKRPRRITRFDFDRVQGGIPSDNDNSIVGPSSSNQPIVIMFVSREDSGGWVVCDEIHVDASDSSPVQRTAAKYMRKQFCLFDTSYNNLIPKTCFEKVTANGTNTILVVRTSQVSTIDNEEIL
ncbi:hypothetical protein CT0861_10703 [Colletotrichum tofieldiae]|uniref:Uncharacterized protein n=1 Tax=Colletotrichum tofieldiae TaxID=708197 RepID=A0A166N712_9PEZI|nr:hypothetical protein CT0861_10703 [Colletotrichum tofieldiae]